MSKTRKDEQLNINTMNVGRMDTWNTGGSLKKPSSGWEFGSGFPQQQNVDPRKAATNSQTLGDPRLAAANMSAAVDPSIALAFAQTMPAFNPADMGQMYAYQMGMMG